nr:tetraacyldisaccharide 4'-kinase [uncultured Pseudodesulfovibrio sp.]
MSESVTELQNILAPVLKPFGWVYGRVMRIRETLFQRGLMRGWEPPVPTVSVGNIGWGGTGKTPVADWLLGWAERQGLQSVLLTRGYGARPTSLPYHVQSGALAEESGDEPLMLARSNEKACVMVDPNRTRAGKVAMERFNPNFVILDDGFQHMAVKRHCNLVLLKPEDLMEGWNRVIPAGSWRESESALARADAFMVKIGPLGFEALMPFIDRHLSQFLKPVFSFQIMPTGVRRLLGGESARDFGKGQYLLVSGVGDPEQVKHTATGYFGYPPLQHMIFKDHHPYSKKDALEISTKARQAGCKAVLCTPKDAVKLGPLCTEEFWEFDLRLDFGPSTLGDETDFESWWNRRFEIIDARLKEKSRA